MVDDLEDVVWAIPRLPFVYKPLEVPHNPDGIPDFMPFHLGVDATSGRLIQHSTPELDAILRRAYEEGSMITGMMDADGIGREYTEDLLGVIHGLTGGAGVDGLRVLEVGCGTGYLLHRLADLGADVRGVEPGPQADVGTARYGVRIDRGFFPDVDVGDDYDLVILYMVLEHVENPGLLLRSINKVVRPGGTVLLAVQDEEPYIRAGELSLLFHEHFSYFTASTLTRTIAGAGGAAAKVIRSTFSNLLIASYKPGSATTPIRVADEDLVLGHEFRRRAEQSVAAVHAKVDAVAAAGGTVGFYVPARGINVLTVNGGPFEDIRFFDDNVELHGSYYPGFTTPVESRESLLSHSPSTVIVMSLSFGHKIVDAVAPGLATGVELITLADLLGLSCHAD